MKVKFVLEAGKHCQGCFGTVPSQWKMVPAQIFKGSRFEYFCNERRERHDAVEVNISEVVPGSCFEAEALTPFDFSRDNNPFNHDSYNMGQTMGTNLMLMFANHTTEECQSLILVNRQTGERVMIHMRKFAEQ